MSGAAIYEWGNNRRPRRFNPPRLGALAVTGIVHALGLIIAIHSQFLMPHKPASRIAEHIVLISRPQKDTDQSASTLPPKPASPAVRAGVTETNPAQPVNVIAPPGGLGPKAEAVTAANIQPPTDHADQSPAGNVAEDYRQVLFARLATQRHYPEAAVLKHYQGDGTVLFRIDRSGNLLDTSMERSTGLALLDSAALKQVRRAAPFPDIPSDLPDELAVAMPVQFLILQPGTRMAAR